MLRTNTKVTLETILFIAVLVACAPLVSAPTSKQDPSSGTDLVSVMAVSDLSAGKNRLAFGLFNANGVEVITDSLEADLYFLGGEEPEHTNSYLAKYRKIETEIPHQHSDGEVHMHQDSRGVYVINDASLDTAGKWGLALRVHQKNKASAQTITLTFQVNEESLTPAVGMPAPASQSPIAKTDTELTAICSRVPPDNMHHMTVGLA